MSLSPPPFARRKWIDGRPIATVHLPDDGTTDQAARITALHAAVTGITEDRDKFRLLYGKAVFEKGLLERREVTDLAELDALPRGSAVLTPNGRVWQKAVTAPTAWWPALGGWERAVTSEQLLGLGIVIVLHIPADDWLSFAPALATTSEVSDGE
ncbi:hypothetical protein [Nocardia sp. NPDC055049]